MSNIRGHSLTRRELLKWLGVSSVVPAVAACVAPSAPGAVAPNQVASEENSASNLAKQSKPCGSSVEKLQPL